MLGKSITFGLLGEDHLPVNLHVKNTSPTLDQFGLDSVPTLNGIRQTGGMRLIISLSAVLDADLHADDPDYGDTQFFENKEVSWRPRNRVSITCCPLCKSRAMDRQIDGPRFLLEFPFASTGNRS